MLSINKRKKLKLLNLLKIRLLLTMLPRIYNRKRFWVRNIYKTRESTSVFFTLMKELREKNPNENINEKFFNYFRMTPIDFDTLLELVKPVLTKSNLTRKSISAAEKLALTLRYLASGDLMTSIAFSFRIGNSTATNIIRETTAALWNVLQKEVFQKYTKHNWENIAQDFYNKTQFPNCIGAIDGKHVLIQAFANSGSLNFNYKKQHSVVLMAICDARYRFTMIDVGAPGSNSDSGVFTNCKFGKIFHGNISKLNLPGIANFPHSNSRAPHVLVGDEAFPLLPNLMRPYPGKKKAEKMRKSEGIFNYRLSRARRLIENTFGILSARWRIFRRPICASRRTVLNIIKATVCLHNWLICRRPESYIPSSFVDTYCRDGTVKEGRWREINQNDTGTKTVRKRGSNAPSKSGKNVRKLFRQYFMHEGELPWQNNYINNVRSE